MTGNYDWSSDVFDEIKKAGISQVATVPDGGLVPLLRSCESDSVINVVTLTTEEEGVAFCSGAWLSGLRSMLMIQSSGVGNLVNMLSLPRSCGIPLLMLVTMRGEYKEFNPWQEPMGQAVPSVLEAMNVKCYRPGTAEEVCDQFVEALRFAFESSATACVLVSQNIIGVKVFE